MTRRLVASAPVTSAVAAVAKRVLAGFLLLDLVVCLRYALADWPQPWLRILGEQNTITWLSSIQLSLIGWLGLAIALVLDANIRHPFGRLRQLAIGGLGLAFIGLSADETLQFHEHLLIRLPGLPAGEGLLLTIALFGVAAAALLLPLFASSPLGLRFFGGACVVAVVSQAVDVPDLPAMGLGWGKALEMAEEVLELVAEAGFIASLLSVLMVQVGRLLVMAVPVSRSASGTPVPATAATMAAEAADRPGYLPGLTQRRPVPPLRPLPSTPTSAKTPHPPRKRPHE
jgi:hypothetical protein